MPSLVNINTEEACDTLVGLVKRQKKICKKNLIMMESVKQGAILAIQECQEQFKSRRWNCSSIESLDTPGNILNKATRESAFVYAISSAAVAHTVTRACSSGKMEQCGCDRIVHKNASIESTFIWSGCSDNIAFGSAFSQTFVDAKERRRKINGRSLMNLHNNQAGRKAIENHMKIQCKCHGVSGTCEMRTCWRAIRSFHEVGEIIKEKFDGATEVRKKNKGTKKLLVPMNPKFKPHTQEDLVYLIVSPDFCEPLPKVGIPGTHGRLCNLTSKAIDGCDLLCCGRGYRTIQRISNERCNCKFNWCCVVKCLICSVVIHEFYCL
eukprot:XP_014777619.1 PREDICTED: protein Wnt-4-like [Octopus bimaculoides]